MLTFHFFSIANGDSIWKKNKTEQQKTKTERGKNINTLESNLMIDLLLDW